LAPVVVPHRPSSLPICITLGGGASASRSVSGGLHKAIQGRVTVYRVVAVPIDMAFVPGWSGILDALRCQMERCNRRTVRIYNAVVQLRRVSGWIIREGGVTSRIRGRCSGWDIELRQAVEGLIGKSVLSPILAQGPKVMIERAIFLGEKDDVIQRLQRSGERGGDRSGSIQSQGTGSLA